MGTGQDGLSRLRGIVIPAGWDEQGNVGALVIATSDENEYSVSMDGKGRELVAFLREKVEVSGIVRNEENKKTVKVMEYRLE